MRLEKRVRFVPGQRYSNNARYWLRFYMMARGIGTNHLKSCGHHHLSRFCYGKSDMTISKLNDIANELNLDFFDLFDDVPDDFQPGNSDES